MAVSLVVFSLFELKAQESIKIKSQTWDFPVSRPHAGVPLSNGKLGWLVWGADRQINISFSRAGFWDRRGGRDFPETATYLKVKQLLKEGNEKGLNDLFGGSLVNSSESEPQKFSQIPGGRLEILLPEDWSIFKGELILQTGELRLISKSNRGQEVAIKAFISAEKELGYISFPPVFEGQIKTRILPAYDFLKEAFKERNIAPPQLLQNKNPENGIKGFEQKLPSDPALSVIVSQEDKALIMASFLGNNALSEAKKLAETIKVEEEQKASELYWSEFWQNIPRLKVPETVFQELWDLGLYKMGCLMRPNAPVCALQGAWMEEYQLPPWANDYHFNINVQLIYLPLLMAGRFEAMEPLWKMLDQWMPKLQENGQRFFGKPNCLLLPHATDDQGKISGKFWAGTMDHGATAWMAQMAYQYYLYSGKNEFLSKTAYPLLSGAFEGYWAMLESGKDSLNKPVLKLPIGVSPEWGGTQISAVGTNPTFQLAACHSITKLLIQAAQTLKKPEDPRWKQVLAELPRFSQVNGPKSLEYPQIKGNRIGIWEGLDLIESHRHHSHLAGIYPFNQINISDTDKYALALYDRSIQHWIFKGQGAWAGWSYPWAASILSRWGKPDAALTLLDTWKSVYVNEGGASVHDAVFGGIARGERDQTKIEAGKPFTERMQLDGNFGFLSAMQEIMVQQQGEAIQVLPALPKRWKNFSFDKIRTENGFMVSAKVENGKLVRVKIVATRKAKLKVYHNLGPLFLASYQYIEDRPLRGAFFERSLVAGDEIVLKSPELEASRPKLIDWNPKKGK